MITSHPNGAVLNVWIVPGAKEDQLVGPYGDSFKVRTAAPADSGRANKALLKQLGGALGTKVELLHGTISRSKKVLLTGLTPDEARHELAMIYNKVPSRRKRTCKEGKHPNDTQTS